MKNKKTLALVLIIAALITIGYYEMSSKDTATSEDVANTESQPVKGSLKSISENDILGTWSPSFDGDESMEFSITEEGEREFGSWLHDRPSTSGTWTLSGNNLTITYRDGVSSPVRLIVERQSDTLLLRDSTGTINAATRI